MKISPEILKFSKINFWTRDIIFNIANACCWLAGRVPNLALHKVWIWHHVTTLHVTNFVRASKSYHHQSHGSRGHLRSFIPTFCVENCGCDLWNGKWCSLLRTFGPLASRQPGLILLSTAITQWVVVVLTNQKRV